MSLLMLTFWLNCSVITGWKFCVEKEVEKLSGFVHAEALEPEHERHWSEVEP